MLGKFLYYCNLTLREGLLFEFSRGSFNGEGPSIRANTVYYFIYFIIFSRLKQLIGRLREDATAVDPDMLISNLEYVAEVVSIMASRTE